MNTKNLNEGKYMIIFNGTNLNEYLIITHEKEVNDIIGTIFSNGFQYFIIQFNEKTEISEVILFKIILKLIVFVNLF